VLTTMWLTLVGKISSQKRRMGALQEFYLSGGSPSHAILYFYTGRELVGGLSCEARQETRDGDRDIVVYLRGAVVNPRVL
jgi:hypothetical protein